MFCDEPVLKVYIGQRNIVSLHQDSFFDCYHDIAYHITKGNRIVLETENHYISLSYKGVKLDKKRVSIKRYEKIGEWLSNCVTPGDDPEEPDWVDLEHTLFFGEHLIEVTKKDNISYLTFDNFSMKIVPHKSAETISPLYCSLNDIHNIRMKGFERLLEKPCMCGGRGELFKDFVSDYYIRCNKCKKATWAQMTVQDALDEWNADCLGWDASNITIDTVINYKK